ncbi:hypothetical protein NT04LS_3319, partial [Listeria seeligeri FSL S4-171]
MIVEIQISCLWNIMFETGNVTNVIVSKSASYDIIKP